MATTLGTTSTTASKVTTEEVQVTATIKARTASLHVVCPPTGLPLLAIEREVVAISEHGVERASGAPTVSQKDGTPGTHPADYVATGGAFEGMIEFRADHLASDNRSVTVGNTTVALKDLAEIIAAACDVIASDKVADVHRRACEAAAAKKLASG